MYCNRPRLLQKLIDELEKAASVIENLSDLGYRSTANNTGSVGGHIRHNLDFVKSLLKGVETGRIDYSARERDPRVEEDRSYAAGKIAETILRIASLSASDLDRTVFVRSEIDPDAWYASSLMRELEFVHSHTVHHHALVAEKLSKANVVIPDHFGVAPSTLEYWNARAAS
jgi:hypothetical protein